MTWRQVQDLGVRPNTSTSKTSHSKKQTILQSRLIHWPENQRIMKKGFKGKGDHPMNLRAGSHHTEQELHGATQCFTKQPLPHHKTTICSPFDLQLDLKLPEDYNECRFIGLLSDTSQSYLPNSLLPHRFSGDLLLGL